MVFIKDMHSAPLPVMFVMYKGLYDFDKLYKAIEDWFNAYMYEYHEDVFKNKEDNIGDELEIKLYGDKKIDEYAKYRIDVHILNSDAEYVEKEINGKIKMLIRGRIRIQIKPLCEFDYQKQYEGSEALKNLGGEEGFMSKHVMDQDISFKYIDDMYYHAYTLQALIKDVLNMDTAGNNY